ncbi:transient receptor potential cation channel subfamily M member 2 [Trichomycterus rosablanca]|uniref:transient receptor potential cation channel subfamily M member 2 n=1 Tax=Trichomycterus rosablanca TaxID=2290929 RepID=UPI002F359DE9
MPTAKTPGGSTGTKVPLSERSRGSGLHGSYFCRAQGSLGHLNPQVLRGDVGVHAPAPLHSQETFRRESKISQAEVDNLQLEKIGLNNLLSHIEKRCSLSSWIKENIEKKECSYYVEGSSDGICECGYQKINHSDEAIKPEEFMGQKYDRHKHVTEVSTDAFGDISFEGIGQKTSKYIRVSSETSSDLLYQLMTELWQLQPPNLLISVTGGAKNFDMKTQLKNKFRRGLIKVAQTTGAWILTGGTHAGVMKHVGRAVRDYNLSSNAVEGQIVAIGVATWGVIHNRQALVHPEGRFPAYYYLDEEGQGRLSCLDINHSHFILVDDGTHGKYGAEIDLRGRLEKLISEKALGNKDSEVTIPVVCVMLDGGPGTLNTIYNSMINHTPCVILEGSGRLADVLSSVASLPFTQITIELIDRLMKKYFAEEYKNFTERDIIEWTKKIQDIARMPELLTVFRIDEEKNCDVDVAILHAFLKASQSSDTGGKQSRERQLELAVAWNRVDIAEDYIFTEERNWVSGDLHHAMFSALLGHKAEFVRLLLENGLCIVQFLQHKDTLRDLYTKMPSCLFLHRVAKRAQEGKITLSHVAAEVQRLLGSFTQPLYSIEPPCHTVELGGDDVDSPSPSKSQTPNRPGSGKEAMSGAGKDLFLWSVVQNQRELSEIAWEQCNDCIAAALAASRILKKLAREGGEHDEQAESMREVADHYEDQAIGVFNECYTCDKQRAQKLLTRVSPSWGGTTCFCLALEANDKAFIAHSGVQALLTQMWCGQLAVDTPYWKLMLCMFFFPLIYTGFVVFRQDEAVRREALRTEQQKMVSGTGSNSRSRHGHRDEPPKSLVRPLNCWTRVTGLYGCPQVKFYWNIVFYFGFLLLFAVVLMMDFQSSPSWRELLLYVWIVSLMCEEVRQLFLDFSDGFDLRKRVKIYIKDLWNILDVLAILLFITGLACRLQASVTVFYVGKVILCIDFIIFCLRLMSIFTISRTLGPKIIIVKKMMMDLFFFMFLLSIWVVAYGVAKQGILIENEERIGWIIRGAVYEPYRIIFGDMPASVDNTQFTLDSCSVNGTDPLKPKCPMLDGNNLPIFPDWLTIIMLCVYLLFANILLLNLLIAIFNYTFEGVQDNTDAIWKFQRYELIKEYHTRPALPPPFILLSHLGLFIKRLILRRGPHQKLYRQELSQKEDEELLSWESFMKDNYLASLKHDMSQSTDQRIQNTAEMVETMSEMLEQKQEWGSVELKKRLTRLEDQVCQSAKALQWIMNALQSQGYKSQQEAPTLTCVAKSANSEPSEGPEQEPEKTHHYRSRQPQYPGSTVRRFPVPEEKVPWEVDFAAYLPSVLDQEESPDSNSFRNPAGRTGIRGRGALKTLGPNLNLDLVITRREGPQLKFLTVWDETAGCFTLPGGPVTAGETLPKILETALGKKLYQEIKDKIRAGEFTELYRDYVDDVGNTDNAWMEATVLNLNWQSLKIDTGYESTFRLEWCTVSSRAPVSHYQHEALRKVAQIHHVNFKENV